MKKKILFKTILLIFLLFSFFQCIIAQNIFINKLNDLNFGEVFIGYSADVKHTDNNAAKFRFYHTNKRKKKLKVNFVLPKFLTNGINKIPITFDQAHTAWSKNDQISGRTNFDPHSRLKTKKIKKKKPIYVWLGASIATTTNLPFGVYSGTIILTVYY